MNSILRVSSQLLTRAVAGYADTEDGVNLIISAVDRDAPRPIWFSNWGTDHGSAESSLKRALDRVLLERGQEGYAQFKSRLRLSSADAFGDHTTKIEPPFSLWAVLLCQPDRYVAWYN
ncbi:nucleoside hydrolase-like domain-containing protein [Pirellulaceae bacterium SH449]